MTRLWAAALPYLAVLAGVYVLRSGWAAILLYHAGVIATLTLLRSWPSRETWTRGWSGALMTFAALLLACLLSGPALYLSYPILAPPSLDLGAALGSLGLRGPSWLAFIAYYTLVNPVLEEGFWRGALRSPSRAPVAGDALFAGYHVLVLVRFIPWTWSLLAAGLLLCTAWVWRQAASRTGGLLIPTLTHLAADASVILAVHLLRARGPRG